MDTNQPTSTPPPLLSVSQTAAPVPFSSKSTTESMKSVVQCSCHGRKKPTWETNGWWTLPSKLIKKTKGWLGNGWWPSNISCTNDWLGTNLLWYRWLTWLVVFFGLATWKKMRRLSNWIGFSFYQSFEVNISKNPLKALPSWRWWNNRIQNKEPFEKWKKTHF